ncbi:germ cell-specific gene 1 protein-like [Paramormyrops kingsleyae]|uniref:germ cell-specific gene 1 protein-like n=1 Tax=Paramormyrops kingsleyae TaxID=1676925 RepID=UPI000CD66BD2|nr:germ cell-specific gene 1 protein-like [Paramormyrops kingsleyae]
MTLLTAVRSPAVTFCQTGVSLLLSAVALLSSYWCVGKQKMPKPLCSPLKTRGCIPVPGMSSNSSSAQFSWETGDDRFVFPSFHSGLWTNCQENIYLDQWEPGEKCRSFMEITPQSEKGLLGMVGHMMFMQVFQAAASMGPEDFKPHSYGYSWAFYVAWVAFSLCMSSGVCTLNSYTKSVLMRRRSCAAEQPAKQPPAPFFYPPPPLPIPPLSPLSPYYSPTAESPPPPPPLAAPPPPCYPTSAPYPSLSLSRSNLAYIPRCPDDSDSL